MFINDGKLKTWNDFGKWSWKC